MAWRLKRIGISALGASIKAYDANKHPFWQMIVFGVHWISAGDMILEEDGMGQGFTSWNEECPISGERFVESDIAYSLKIDDGMNAVS